MLNHEEACMNPKEDFVSCRTPEQDMEERKCNYERYRGLVQNDFANSEYHRCLSVRSAQLNWSYFQNVTLASRRNSVFVPVHAEKIN